ncbi:hypothetical protein L1887_51476 [Cichorium endivia]|nr:hypothetical protein L1887_51476 [Cichorium endivia]
MSRCRSACHACALHQSNTRADASSRRRQCSTISNLQVPPRRSPGQRYVVSVFSDMSAAYSSSSRALAFLSETSEDAIAALKGLVGGVGSAKYLDTSEDKLSTIATQIDSSRDEDRIAALTRIVAMISKGRDASSFLPAVLKLTSCANLDVRKLVYIVLLRYANSNPDLTLLSINSFQRDLSDPSPLIRAMALRVLSSIKVAMVSPIVLMAVTKAARDPNLYVRKIAALAIPKCHSIDKSQLESQLEVLGTLLADRSPFVLSDALAAFQRVCPNNWQLIHPNYRRICHALSDMDEWGQITAIEVLSRYARSNLPRPKVEERSMPEHAAVGPSQKLEKDSTAKPRQTEEASNSSERRNDLDGLEAFLSSNAAIPPPSLGARSKDSKSSAVSLPIVSSSSDLDRDLELLLGKAQALLHSRNPAVVLAVTRLIFYLAPAQDHRMLTRPLVRLLRSSPDVSYLVLLNILAISRHDPSLFAPFTTSFLLGASHEEPIFLSLLKLDLLVLLCNASNCSLVLAELGTHMRSADAAVSAHAVACLGELALVKKLDASSACLSMLLDLLRRRKSGPRVHDSTVARAVLEIKNLLQLSPELAALDAAPGSRRTSAIVYRLAALLFGTTPKPNPAEKSKRKNVKPKVVGKGSILHPEARASILWLLGQHARQSISISTSSSADGKREETRTLAELVVPDVLRRCAVNFANESSAVKLQILTTSSKVFAFLPTALVPTPGATAADQGRSEQLMSAVTVLHFYLLKLARYDADFDVRDRARFLKGLTAPLAATQAPSPATEGDKAAESHTDSIQAAIELAARTLGETVSEDDADLKGVRLRREQVVHVLFEGKASLDPATSTVSEGNNEAGRLFGGGEKASSRESDGPEIASLSLVLGGKLIKGWLNIKLPAWTEQPTPASLREPPSVSQPSLPTLQGTSLSNLKSFSSSDFSSNSPRASTPVILTPGNGAGTPLSQVSGNATPTELDASLAPAQTQQKYKDLDSFLDESDDEQEAADLHLDDSAPEDDDFVAEERWDDDDAEVDLDDEEEDEDEDEDEDEEDDSAEGEAASDDEESE